MPLQDSWVELWLRRYCAPGEHSFRVLRPDVLVCETCGKQELASGATCLFCGIPGEHSRTVEYVNDIVHRLSGRLCGSCLDEFEARRTICGWQLAS